ncbi:C3H1-type domain-containing protein [Caenorhabditis elegans]|uniref:C3H1-type domain-containing protein n=1 Tax=Caenorhabditis elegans TaxID=6239 RepID=Q9U2V4_CAEEL|nr:C3H1-type domain-containing protein [Caenorhabditis elegans]CAB55123.1 C3H1-type domain-containing protein [Caenorhabditis elegans]|eukprot:NP_503017.1 DAF-16/FOXO Controlled, germline Tumor affecting [Caenorhabditis elegans]
MFTETSPIMNNVELNYAPNTLSNLILTCAFPANSTQSLSSQSSTGSSDQHSVILQENESAHKLSSAIANCDPCTISDELREEMMRLKKKEKAFKTSLCLSHKRGKTCIYGEACKFAHGVHELRCQQTTRNHRNYKTVLCDKFTTTGYCKYGARCQFIHRSMDTTPAAKPMETADFKPNVQSDLSRAFALDSSSFLPNWHCSALLQ